MNDLTEVTKYRESQKQQHRKDCALRKKEKPMNKHIIGRQTYNGTHTHIHRVSQDRKKRKEKFLFLLFSFFSLSQIVFFHYFVQTYITVE
jgi:hypothetical protein